MEMDKWMSTKQVCAYLNISRDTATKWIKNKGMPAHQIDRIWRFDKDEVDEWMRSNGKCKIDSSNNTIERPMNVL